MGFTIYSLENVENGKKYIGLTANYKRRKYQHLNSLKNNSHQNIDIQKDCNKHGLDSFSFNKLKTDIKNGRIANYYEKMFIAKYKSNKNGYNKSTGGDSLWGCYGYYDFIEEKIDELNESN